MLLQILLLARDLALLGNARHAEHDVLQTDYQSALIGE